MVEIRHEIAEGLSPAQIALHGALIDAGFTTR